MSDGIHANADKEHLHKNGAHASVEAGVFQDLTDPEGVSTNPSLEAWAELKNPRNDPLRALFVMVFLEVSGFALCIPCLAFFAIKELGLRPSELGFIMSANAFSQMVGSWGCGRLSDSVGRKWLLLGSYAWSCMNIGGTAFVYSFTQLLILRMVGGLSGGTTPLCQAYIMDWVPEQRRPGLIGLFGCINGCAFLCGNLLGTVLLVLELERRVIFLIAALLASLATLYGLLTIEESLEPKNRRSLCGANAEGNITPRGTTSDLEAVNIGLVCVWCTRFFLSLGNAIILTMYAFFIDHVFGWTDMHFGAMMVFAGTLFAFLQFAVYPLFGRYGKAGSAASSLVANICGVCGGLVFPFPFFLLHMLAIALLAAAAAFSEPAIPVLVGFFAGEAHLGFGNGVATAFRCAASILGPYLGGVLFEQGVQTMCWAGVAIFCIGVISSVGIALSPTCSEEALAETSLIKPKS